ncbi:MAG: hypothetical protein JXA74_17010 [Anaerolineae bacterium]|nr:hypothetical protein [Anaerolineae bacterium]
MSLADWRTNLDIGLKAYVVQFVPLVFGAGGARLLGLDVYRVRGGALVAAVERIGVALMVWIMKR